MIYMICILCLSVGKQKNKEWKCLGCGGKWKCAVSKLRAHILSIKGRDIKPCSKYYTAEQLKPMKDLEQQLAQASASQKRQRIEAELDPLLDPGPSALANAVQESAQQPTQQPRSCKPMQAQQPLSLLPHRSTQRQLRLPEMAIAQRHDRANMQLSMLFYGCGIPFNVARSPLFKRAMQTVAECGPRFKPVSYDALRGPMVEKVGV